jgi:hypothetical protein
MAARKISRRLNKYTLRLSRGKKSVTTYPMSFIVSGLFELFIRKIFNYQYLRFCV